MEKEELLHRLEKHHTGYRNAVSSRYLETVFQVRGACIRKTINELRCAGHPICSGEEGYYYAANSMELTATIRQLSSRITKIAGAKNGLVRAAEQYSDSGQLSLPL